MKFEIHVDYGHPLGACFYVGPFRVTRRDYGKQVDESGKRPRVVYRELYSVDAFGKTYCGFADVDATGADAHVAGPAKVRFEAAVEALEKIRKQIEKDVKVRR